MSFYGWDNCPSYTKEQIQKFNDLVIEQLGTNLIGIYLHGSLVMKSFNPEKSDIDLLVVTLEQMQASEKCNIIEELLKISNKPHPIEVSFLIEKDLKGWTYPTPYDLHYSEDWRSKFREELENVKWKDWNNNRQTDSDLAAHITITLKSGITLYGEAINSIFPAVDKNDYRDSLLQDFNYALADILEKPVYGILNPIRIYAYILDGLILSKIEAGLWGINNLPKEFKKLISDALQIYKANKKVEFDQEALNNFKKYVYQEVNKINKE